MSCTRAWMAAAHSFSFARRNASSLFQVLKASDAAATAWSTWARVPRGQVANGSPRAGLMTSSCSGVVTERPLISMEYELIETPPRGWRAADRLGLTHPSDRGKRSGRGPSEWHDAAPWHGPARQSPGETVHDHRGDVDAQTPFCGRFLAAAPFGKPDASDGTSVAIGGLPVEAAAFDVADRSGQRGQQRRPLAVDGRIAGTRARQEELGAGTIEHEGRHQEVEPAGEPETGAEEPVHDPLGRMQRPMVGA